MTYRRLPLAVAPLWRHARGVSFRGLLVAAAMLLLAVQMAVAAPFASYVMDARTGETLQAENADARLHPASLTKMMTLYIAFEAIRNGEISLDTPVLVSKKAAAEQPSKLGLKAGQRIQLRYLIRAAAILSANDAATAIGEAISGSEAGFAQRMNRTAKALGMKRTTFKNANGLTEAGHLSTARDMSILGRHLIYDYPEYYNLFSRQSAHAGVRTVTSHNRLLQNYEGADGIKTGYTVAAGFNLTASAKRGDVRIIATVFGGTSTAARDAKVAELLDLGFRKAKRNVRTVRPQPPSYAVPDEVLVAAMSGAGLARSPLPRRRPAQAAPVMVAAAPGAGEGEPSAEMLAALQDGVDAALAAAMPADDSGTDSAIAPTVEVGADVLLAAVAPPPARPDIDAPEMVATADAASDAAPAPQAVADPALAAAASGDQQSAEPAAALALAPPPPRPAAIAGATVADDAVVEVAAAGSNTADAAPEPAQPLLVAMVEPDQAAAADAPDEVADASAAVPDAGPDDREELALLAEADDPPAMGQPVPLEALPLAADPAAAGGHAHEEVLASIEPEVFPDHPAQPEVVTRLSTSGGHHWGVSVGLYGSQYEAERVLLTTALKEVSTLGTALRKVTRTKRGFEANFMGLSQDMATLACGRLQALNVGCTTIGPG